MGSNIPDDPISTTTPTPANNVPSVLTMPRRNCTKPSPKLKARHSSFIRIITKSTEHRISTRLTLIEQNRNREAKWQPSANLKTVTARKFQLINTGSSTPKGPDIPSKAARWIPPIYVNNLCSTTSVTGSTTLGGNVPLTRYVIRLPF